MEQLRLHLLLLTVAAFTLWPLARGADLSVRAKEGGVAVLRCSIAGMDVGAASLKHVVEWVRKDLDIPILIKFGRHPPRVHPDYEGRVSLLGESALSLQALRLEDQGRYECRILPLEQTSEETRNGIWTFLSVYAAPSFTETSPPVVEALLGKPLTLRCVVRGNPPPTVTWAKDGVLLKPDNTEVRDGIVSFQSVTREAAGEYRCDASNSEGSVSRVTRLSVKGPPVIRIPPTDLVLDISQRAELQCQADADPPNMTYVWQREGENVHHIQSLKSRVKVLVDGTLLISGLAPEDSGNYMCTPTNGLLTPPSASATLTVRHPAQVLNMPRETYLPTGMGGAIPCPVRAEPPLLRVDWTKDGTPLDLDTQYPGWTLTSQGSVVMATASEDAAGVYTCTPYNALGTMGQSAPTRVILQDPPSFKVSPRQEYRQQVGRMLVIPCEAAGDPAPSVTWSKVGRSPVSPFSAAPNGSLVLQPLSKDQQGAWECSAANRVATVNASTTVLVLGTSPHAVALLSVSAGLNHANVSWEPGFDGGYTQKFTIWLKRASSEASAEKQEWTSVPVPPSAGTSLRVSDLLPSTDYQFSVLPQNKMGTGPFSDIAAARTLDPQPVAKELAPPSFLSATLTGGGVVVRWKAPPGLDPPVESFLLQSRLEGGQWANLVEGINADRTHMVLQDLSKDSVYELRLLSQRGSEQSAPSASRNISTAGLEVSVSPASRGLQQVVPEPLLAGLVGGLGVLCVALLLTIGTACVYRRRSNQRKRRRDDLTPALLASPSGTASAAGGSPDSVLKHQLLPPHPDHSSSSSSSSSSPGDPSSLERSHQADYRNHQQHHQHQQQHQQQQHQQQGSRSSSSRALPPLPESTLRGGSGPLSPLSPLELISRGPDGRFCLDPGALETLEEMPFSRTPVRRSLQADFSRCPSSSSSWGLGGGGGGGRGGPQRSHSLRSYREERRGGRREMDTDVDAPFVVSVDVPAASYCRGRAMAKHLSLQGDHLLGRHDDFHLVPELPERSSLLSEGSHASDAYSDPSSEHPQCPGTSSGYATLKRTSGGGDGDGGDASGTGGTGAAPGSGSLLVLQMEHERERGNLSRCLTLAREREALERELRKYASDRHSLTGRDPQQQEDPELVWKTRDGASPSTALHSSRGHYSPEASGRGSTRPSSSILWEASPLSSPTRPVPVPVQTHGVDGEWTVPGGERTKRSPLCEAEAELTPRDEKHRRSVVRQASELRRACVSPERLSVSRPWSRGYEESQLRAGGAETPASSAVDAVPDGPDESTFIEMSVDGPEIEARYHTIAADRRGGRHTHTHWDTHTPQQQQRTGAHTHRWERDVSGGQPSRTVSHLDVLRPDLRRSGSLGGSLGGSQRWHRHQSTQSLDHRKRAGFLTPDAWVHSLNQGRAGSAVPFASYPQHREQDQDQHQEQDHQHQHQHRDQHQNQLQNQDQDQDQEQEVCGDPYSRIIQSRSRDILSQPSFRETPQSPPPRGATPNPSFRDAVTSPGQRPDPRRQASAFPQELMGNPRHQEPTPRSSRPRERREGYPTPDRGTSPHQTGYPTPDRGTSLHQTGYPTPDRGTSPHQTGYPTPDRGTSPHQTGYPTPDRGTSLHQTGYPTPDRGTSPHQTGYPTPDRGTSPHQTGYPTPDRGTSPHQTGYPTPAGGHPGHQRALSPLARSSSPPERRGLSRSDRRRRSPPSADGGPPRPGTAAGETYGWQHASWAALPGAAPGEEQGRRPAEEVEVTEKEEEEEEAHEEESQEVDAEIRGYRHPAAESEGRYRSYASQSSGRGSLDPPNSLSPPPTSSPETTEESEHHEKGLRRGSSVDENYEWDTHYVPMKPVYVKPGQVQLGPTGERSRGHGVKGQVTTNGGGERGMFPSIRLLKSGGSFSCAGLPHHRSAESEPETVLF
ncbi:uncharacterized protein igsf9a [Sardina pilchardus]|uniref:uncharacterized protein igsf9a n=1 Tax=Sardina pilchardus TaxID=27697 RepID=UPI002E124543